MCGCTSFACTVRVCGSVVGCVCVGCVWVGLCGGRQQQNNKQSNLVSNDLITAANQVTDPCNCLIEYCTDKESQKNFSPFFFLSFFFFLCVGMAEKEKFMEGSVIWARSGPWESRRALPKFVSTREIVENQLSFFQKDLERAHVSFVELMRGGVWFCCFVCRTAGRRCGVSVSVWARVRGKC